MMTTYTLIERYAPVRQFALLTLLGLFAGLSPVHSWEDAVCSGIHCYDTSAHCCIDDNGVESCCYQSVFEETWFWCLLVIGVILIAVVMICTCRAVYRYWYASQYTKLRLQQPDCYSGAPGAVITVHVPPSTHDGSNQLPSYGTIVDRPPPAYSETDDQR